MTAGTTHFPSVENGYSPEHVDVFIARLVRRARQRIAELEQKATELEERLASGTPHDGEPTDADGGDPDDPPRLPASHVCRVAGSPDADGDSAQEPAPAVVERTAYDGWTDERRERAAHALRRNRLSA